jgi:hypothetical protein
MPALLFICRGPRFAYLIGWHGPPAGERVMPMQDEHQVAEPKPEQRQTDFGRFTSYEDGDSVVIYDSEKPTAWIRSDVATSRQR